MEEMQIKIRDWKAQYKNVVKIQSDDEEVAYLKTPTLTELDAYNNLKQEDVFKALQYLFHTCILENTTYEDEFLLSASRALVEHVASFQKETINNNTGYDDIKKSAALVRHYFHVDPYQLPTEEFYKLVSEALWLQDHKNKQLEYTIANVLVNTFGNAMQ